jgi:acyl dehydratase
VLTDKELVESAELGKARQWVKARNANSGLASLSASADQALKAMTLAITDIEQFRGLVGQTIGASDWLEVTQERIDRFADATGDHQWIHCDPQRAARESPYGATIAHGFLTLSLCSSLAQQVLQVSAAQRIINYGLNRVRFPNAVRCGSRVQLVLKLAELRELTDAIETQYECTVEIEGETKPACVATWLLRLYSA